jgi:hypothetical protein
MLQGALRLQRGGDTENAFPLLVHIAHPISGGCGHCVQKSGHLGHVLGSPGEGGELPLRTLNRCGPTCLKCRLTLFAEVISVFHGVLLGS